MRASIANSSCPVFVPTPIVNHSSFAPHGRFQSPRKPGSKEMPLQSRNEDLPLALEPIRISKGLIDCSTERRQL